MKLLSTRMLAAALGVSESSIKRWVDDGFIVSSKTSGGHRRIAIPDAIRFVRERRLAIVRPEILGLEALTHEQDPAPAAERLERFLAAGAGVEARALVVGLYLDGQSVAQIVDGALRPAMHELGELWRRDRDGIFVEHRATEICLQSLAALRALLPARTGTPLAVGGAASTDPYLLPSMAAAAVLAAEGFSAINLGPELPVTSLERAVEHLQPRLVWLSVSATSDPRRLAREITAFAARLEPSARTLVVGGRALDTLGLSPGPNLQTGSSMAELAAFARGLLAAVSPVPGEPAST